MRNILYVFGAEKASGAENVILRLIEANISNVSAHIFLAPGDFANALLTDKTEIFNGNIYPKANLKKLNRGESSKFSLVIKALYNYIANSYSVIKYINSNNIDVVHANTVVPASYILLAVIYSKFFFKKTKWVWSDHDLEYFSTIDNYMSKICASCYDLTFAVSKAVKGKYKLSSKVEVLYNGIYINNNIIDLEEKNRHRQELSISTNNIVIGIAAAIIQRKGLLGLVKVFIKLTSKFNNITLLIAGQIYSHEMAYGDLFLKKIEGVRNILYLGAVSDMNRFYNVCDIVINNTSQKGSEPLGTTIIEAMSHEKIFLASDTGGTPEIITNGEDGFLFAADNLDALEANLLYCIENVNNLEFIRTNAKSKIRAKFNIEDTKNQYNYNLDNLTKN